MKWHGKAWIQGLLEHGNEICSSFKSNEVIQIKSNRKSRNKSEKFSKKRKFRNPGCYKNRTHLSKQTRSSTERSRRASHVRGIPSRPDDQLRWVLIVRTQVHDMGGELPYSQTSRLNHTIDYLITLT